MFETLILTVTFRTGTDEKCCRFMAVYRHPIMVNKMYTAACVAIASGCSDGGKVDFLWIYASFRAKICILLDHYKIIWKRNGNLFNKLVLNKQK